MTRHQGHDEGDKDQGPRLPKCVTPVHYDISIQPDKTEPKLKGRMTIKVQVHCETDRIVLNALNISVTDVEYVSEGSFDKIEARIIDTQNDKEIVTLYFHGALAKGSGRLSLNFESKIYSDCKGAFSSGKSILTHMEPVNCRRVFPCFDEPLLKATFDTTLIVNKELVALANMSVKEEFPHEKDDELRVVKFQTTPKMSTYLFAFVIGEFDVVEGRDENGVRVRIWAPPGKKNQGEFALDLAKKTLPFYAEYFGGIPYPLGKCDLVATPDFGLGAMENWGLVIFRDLRLLVDSQESSTSSKLYTALVICHELAHFWFGNLVTMKWWQDLWLKEGFANFIENLCADKFFPEFDVWTHFVSDNTFDAMAIDSLKNSHPIEVEVNNPGEIDEIFDSITYSKGCSIIRMMFNYISEDSFRKGMNVYLNRFKYSNAETRDLWEALGETSGLPVGQMMDTFTKQMGYPLVTVLSSEQKGNDRILTLKQQKFWSDPKLYDNGEGDSYKWMIPLTFSTASNPNCHQVLFNGKESTTTQIIVPNISESEWLKINTKVIGYYRVSYPPQVLAQFTEAIRNKSLSPVDRAGLLKDVYATAKCGQSSTVEVLKMLKAFENEDSYVVWSAIKDIVVDIQNLFLRTPEVSDKFRTFATKVFLPLKIRLGWSPKPKEGHADTLLRSLVLNLLISFGHNETIDEGKKLFQAHVNGEQMVTADLRVAVYKSHLAFGEDAELHLLLNMFRETEMSEEKVRILNSFCVIKNEALLQKILTDFGLSNDVKQTMFVSLLVSLSGTKEGQDLIWKFFKEKVKLFQERYPGGFQIVRVVETVCGNFSSEEMAADVQKFFSVGENVCRGTERTVQQVIETIGINASWLNRDKTSVAEFLDAQNLN